MVEKYDARREGEEGRGGGRRGENTITLKKEYNHFEATLWSMEPLHSSHIILNGHSGYNEVGDDKVGYNEDCQCIDRHAN